MADLLDTFSRAGVLTAGDVRVARTLGALGSERSAEVLLGAALAARAPRHGHVCVELDEAAQRIVGDDEAGDGADADASADAGAGQQDAPDMPALPWPDVAAWIDALEASELVRAGDESTVSPLVLHDGRLYLDRYWRYQRRIADALVARSSALRTDVDPPALRAGLRAMFGPASAVPDRQRTAALLTALRSLTVISGGPGTGKTSTVARILGLLHLQPAARPLRVALAAPTGKAAARLGESLRTELAGLALPEDVRRRVAATPASTLHRLLGVHPGSATRFRHHAEHRLPFDVVVVDEASMVSLSLMAKLVDAVAPEARLILLGDRDQLASVEAGAALGDICGPLGARIPLRLSPEVHGQARSVGGEEIGDVEEAPAPGIWDGIVVLDHFYRFGHDSGIGEVARAIQRVEDDTEEVLDMLDSGFDDVALVDPSDDAAAGSVRTAVVAAYGHMVRLALDGAAPARVLAALDELRVLCAVRRGPEGVETYNERIEAWLTEAVTPFSVEQRWYVGRPVLVLENDHGARLYNGDVGVVLADPARADRRIVAFPGADGEVRCITPSRLPRCETTFAMTVHKSQGSQFGHAVVVLPRTPSPILTRELVYTGVTRARSRATLVADAPVLRQALRTPVQRASGLRSELWSDT